MLRFVLLATQLVEGDPKFEGGGLVSSTEEGEVILHDRSSFPLLVGDFGFDSFDWF